MKQYTFLFESLNFKLTKKRTDFGWVYYYDTKEGRFALYYYDDDKDRLFLSNVDIWEKYQGKGYGNDLLKYAINESNKLSKKFGFKYLFLYCLKTSFVHNWYKKFGFEDYKDYEKDTKYIWMYRKF